MTKLSYEIYNVKTDEVLGACTDYTYRQVYTPMANADPNARNYREWYRNGVPAKA